MNDSNLISGNKLSSERLASCRALFTYKEERNFRIVWIKQRQSVRNRMYMCLFMMATGTKHYLKKEMRKGLWAKPFR